MTAQIISAITALVSVLLSGTITAITLRRTRRESEDRRRHEYLMGILPRRLDALEMAWQLVFSREAGEELSDDAVSKLVSHSIWLPSGLRQSVTAIATDPTTLPNADQVHTLRLQLSQASGAAALDQLQSHLVERPTAVTPRPTV